MSMLRRLLALYVRWVSEPVAGDRVIVVEPITGSRAGVVPIGTTGFVVWSTAFENPGRPVGRVRFDQHQPALGEDQNLLVWPAESGRTPTWGYFSPVRAADQSS